jgi:hypothetical protein
MAVREWINIWFNGRLLTGHQIILCHLKPKPILPTIPAFCTPLHSSATSSLEVLYASRPRNGSFHPANTQKKADPPIEYYDIAAAEHLNTFCGFQIIMFSLLLLVLTYDVAPSLFRVEQQPLISDYLQVPTSFSQSETTVRL